MLELNSTSRMLSPAPSSVQLGGLCSAGPPVSAAAAGMRPLRIPRALSATLPPWRLRRAIGISLRSYACNTSAPAVLRQEALKLKGPRGPFLGLARGLALSGSHGFPLRRRGLLVGVAASAFGIMATSNGQSLAQGSEDPSSPPQAAFLSSVPAPPVGDSGYAIPPPEILSIVDTPPNPALSFSPQRDRVLFLRRPSFPPIVDFARPELKLAGIRIDPGAYTRSKMSSYLGISIHRLGEDDSLSPDSLEVTGLPEGGRINFVSWSPDGQHIAFTVRRDNATDGSSEEEARRLSLWVADVESGQARKILGYPDFFLNAVFDTYAWLDNSSLMALALPASTAPPPPRPAMPAGPKISDNQSGEKAQSRTFTDLLKDEHDADLFEHYATSQMVHISLDGSWRAVSGPRIYSAMEPSNDGKFLLVTEMRRPFSLEVPCGRFPCTVRVLRAEDGEVLQTVADLPLADNIPVTFNSVRQGRRGIGWRPDCDATLYWVETQDGGDAKAEVSPRDIVFSLPADPSPGDKPQVLHSLDLRYGVVSWGASGFALCSESWHKTRRTRTWAIDSSRLSDLSCDSAPGAEHLQDPTESGNGAATELEALPLDVGAGSAPPLETPPVATRAVTSQPLPQLVFDRSYEDRYADPGYPMVRRTLRGTYLIAEIETAGGGLRLLLNGDGATPEGNIPFIDLFDVDTGEKERIWSSDSAKYYESISSILSDTKDGPIPLDSLKVLISRESQEEPPQYFIKRWRDGSEVQLTSFPHPYPSLRGISKEIIKYPRSDGVQLTGTLYLPPGYSPERDGPLPLVMWAYPREYKSKDAAGQVRGSPNSFPGIGAASPLLFLARGYAVLSGPSMPIIGEGDQEANDSFVEQLVASAEAAVEEVVLRGVATRGRIAIGGHSYGAFMAANLVAHAPGLFCCAIAQSGAYNRTLTPFSFQQEERTLWQARDVYLTMSPFLMADRISTPMLLVHGQDDNNAGTFPMQTERFFQALKGHGAPVRMVLLPHEGHGYRARESLLHVLAEQSAWLDRYCKGAPGAAHQGPAGAGAGVDSQTATLTEADDAASSTSSAWKTAVEHSTSSGTCMESRL